MNSEKKLFLILHFLGVGLMVGGCFIDHLLTLIGLGFVVTNALMMCVVCNIEFK